MDFYRSKLFGFQRLHSLYKFYDPQNIKYLKSKDHGYFEAPKFSKNRTLNHLVYQFKQKSEFEKYMNPKGLKYTFTSNFPKVASEIYLANPNIYLVRTDKKYPANFAKFNVPMNYSKLEIKQFLEKMYQVKIIRIHTSILPGNVKFDNEKRRFIRTRDVKRAAVEFASFVDIKYRKINASKKLSLNEFEEMGDEVPTEEQSRDVSNSAASNKNSNVKA